MASGFTEQEQESIKKSLKDSARGFASTIGMKKTTVEQLADSANISKGAFYKFYQTKEELFFEVLECWHTELYNAALDSLNANAEWLGSKRAAKAILTVCSIMEQNSMMSFMENDLPSLLRKIPGEILQKHYHSDDIHIKDIIARSNLKLTVSPEVASAAVRGLLLTISHKKDIGEHYSTVLSVLVEGVCEKIVF